MPEMQKSPIVSVKTLTIQTELVRPTSDVYFFLALSGNAYIKTGSQTHQLTSQSVIMVGSEEPFSLRGNGENVILIVALKKDFFLLGASDRFGRYICDSTSDSDRDYSCLRQLLSSIALNRFENDELHQIREIELAYSLLYLLNRFHFVEENIKSRKSQAEQRRQRIVSYLESNYQEPLSLQDLAGITHLTPTYLSRYFKETFQENFYAHLYRIRLAHALDDLVFTASSITLIALNNGFPSVNAFNKHFQEQYQVSPSEYRRTHKASPLADPLPDSSVNESIRQQLMNYAQTSSPVSISSSFHQPQQHLIMVDDVRKVTKVKPIWKSMINIGFSTNLSNYSIQSQLNMVQKEIGFYYGRIQGVLNSEVVSQHSSGEFNYSAFDRNIEQLLSIGLVPFLDLSFRPNYNILSETTIIAPTSESETPVDLVAISNKLNAIVRHCINTFGTSEVSRWGFEIGYHQDAFLRTTETPSDFIRRFQNSYLYIKTLLPNAIVGGPCFNLTLSAARFEEYLAEMDLLKFSPDFISLSAFPYQFRAGTANPPEFVYASDPDFIINRTNALRQLLSNHPNVSNALYITAFGTDVKTRNLVNDTCFQATYFLRNTLRLIGKVDVLGYWQLSDIDSEHLDAVRILFGGTGILSKHGLKKPGFSALKRLGYISNDCILQKDDFLVTTNSSNTYYIVLCNYAYLSEFFCINLTSAITLENVYSAFNNAEEKSVSVQLNHLKPGKYRINTSILNQNFGCLLDTWIHYGILDNLQPQDIQYFRDIVHPQRLAEYVECQNGLMEIRAQLQPHESRFIEITLEI